LEEAASHLDSRTSSRPVLRAALLRGRLAYAQNELEAARDAYENAAALARDLCLPADGSEAMRWLGTIAGRSGDPAGHERLTREAMALAERASDAVAQSKALNNLGMLLSEANRGDEADAAFERSLEIKRAIGHRTSTATSLLNYGNFLHSKRRDDLRAEQVWRQALAIFEALDNAEGRSLVTINLAVVAMAARRLGEATLLLRRALESIDARGDIHAAVYARWLLGNVEIDLGEEAQARATVALLAPRATESTRTALHVAALEARLAARGASVEGAVQAACLLADASSEVDYSSWDLEDLPIAAWREAGERVSGLDATLAAGLRSRVSAAERGR